DAGLAGQGITLRLPVYSRGAAPTNAAERRAREIGALAISLKLEPLVTSALAGRIPEYMHVAIHDPDAPGDGRVFEAGPAPGHGAPVKVRQMEFGGRRWELRMRPYAARPERGNTASIIAIGSLISLLLSLLLWSIASTHRRALALAQRMGARFGESERGSGPSTNCCRRWCCWPTAMTTSPMPTSSPASAWARWSASPCNR